MAYVHVEESFRGPSWPWQTQSTTLTLSKDTMVRRVPLSRTGTQFN